MTYRLRSVCAVAVGFIVPLGVYIASLRPGVDYWDTGELQTVPFILGIAHPSGFPAYVLIGWVWSHLIPFGDPAYRMNLLSAVGMTTAAAGLTAALLELGVEPVCAGGAALVFAFTRVPWDHATHADVHPVALAAIALSIWTALRWNRTGSARALLACAAFAGLALGVHSGTILIVPGIVLATCARRPRLRSAAGCVGVGVLLVVGAYAYLPLRSAQLSAQQRDPTLALGLPPGRPFWDADHPSSVQGFRLEVGGAEFGASKALVRLIDPTVWARLPERYGRATVGDLAGGVMVIALVGAIVMLRRRPLAGLGILGGSLLPVLFVLAYPAESDPERYYLPSYWTIGLLLGVGADYLARGGLSLAPRPIVALLAGLFLFVAASDIYVERGFFLAGRDTSAQAFIDRVVHETPPNAVVVAPWMYATPLAYAAYVERRLGKRILVTGWPDDYTAYYPAWLADRPVTFVTDEPILAVSGVRVRERDLLGPAPHLFYALATP